MTEADKQAMIELVVRVVKEDPEMFVRVVCASQVGLESRADEAAHRAAGFETATLCLLRYIEKRQRYRKGLLTLALNTVTRWRGKTCVNWDSFQLLIDAHAEGRK